MKLLALFLLIVGLTTPLQAADVKKYELNIDADSICSFTVKPNKPHGATKYQLRIYTYASQKIPVISTTNPLHGKIVDADIYDIDKDGKDELVIKTASMTNTQKSYPPDVYELNETTLFTRIIRYLSFFSAS